MRELAASPHAHMVHAAYTIGRCGGASFACGCFVAVIQA